MNAETQAIPHNNVHARDQSHPDADTQMQRNRRIANIAITANYFELTIDDEVHAVQALWLFVSAHFVCVCV